jgi:hypothetical protein
MELGNGGTTGTVGGWYCMLKNLLGLWGDFGFLQEDILEFNTLFCCLCNIRNLSFYSFRNLTKDIYMFRVRVNQWSDVLSNSNCNWSFSVYYLVC